MTTNSLRADQAAANSCPVATNLDQLPVLPPASIVTEPASCALDRARGLRLNAMSGMASMFAHELSQPLTATTNYLAGSLVALRERIAALDEVLKMVDGANRQAVRAQDLVRRMRTFVRDGRIEGAREDLAAMLASAWAATPGTEGVDLAVSIAPGAGLVLVDRLQFELVLGNLLLNAVQALAGRTGARIEADAIAADGRVTLTIADNGPGIDPEARARLFEPMFTTRTSGLGLGLPICLTIMEAHGGAIWLEPQSERTGAAFTLVVLSAEPVALPADAG